MLWYFFDTGQMNGFENMAHDLAILDQHLNIPVLRFYEWSPPALSLGRFQSLTDIDLPYLEKMKFDLVRRPSGGRAVLHYDELTYSIVMPLSLAGESVIRTYLDISNVLVDGLRDLGMDCKISEVKKANYQRFAACFAVTSIYEITVDNKKLIGSAQLRRNGMVLQHGSIPMRSHLEEYSRCFLKNKEGIFETLRASMTSVDKYSNVDINSIKESVKKAFERIMNAQFVVPNFDLNIDKYLKETKVWD